MASKVYRCPACDQEFISVVAGPRNRVICPHCSNSELASRYPEVAPDQTSSRLSRLPPARTGQSHRAKRTQDPSPPASPPGLASTIEALFRGEPEHRAQGQPDPAEPASTGKAEKHFADVQPPAPAPIQAPVPVPPLVPPRAEAQPKTSPRAASPIASAVDADFEIVIVHPELSELGARSLLQSEALHALEPWESDGAVPATNRWSRIALIALAALLLIAVGTAALLFAL